VALARGDGEGDVVECGDAGEGFGDVAVFDHGSMVAGLDR
jgi:hypothetical protein